MSHIVSQKKKTTQNKTKTAILGCLSEFRKVPTEETETESPATSFRKQVSKWDRVGQATLAVISPSLLLGLGLVVIG